MSAEDNAKKEIQIIDESAKSSYKVLRGLFLCFFIFPCLAVVAMGIAQAMTKSQTASSAVMIISYFVIIAIWIAIKIAKKNKQGSFPSIAVNKDEYKMLLGFLNAYGNINSYYSLGDIAKREERFAMRELTKQYDTAYFIRFSSDHAKASVTEQKLIKKIFGYENHDNVFWFTPKDRRPLHITFCTTDDGTEMKFRHGLYETDLGFQAIELRDGECILHIYDDIAARAAKNRA